MNFIKLVAVFLILSFSAKAQRYLTPIFSATNATVNIQYGSNTNYRGQNENLYLDFYEPQADTLTKRPLIIYIHGGGFVDTNQNKSLLHIIAFADSMARRGYAVASINYRLDSSISNRAVIQAMHDAKAAVRFFKANATTCRLDTNFFFIGGESAGAVTALTTSYLNQASEINYPPTLPLSSDLSLEGASGTAGFSSDVKAVLCYCGGTQTVFNEPLFDTLAMQQNDKPVLFLHGTADPLIPVQYAVNLAVRATNQNIPNLFYTFHNAGHCPWIFPLPNSVNYLDSLINYTLPFLYACLNPTAIQDDPIVKKEKLLIYPNPTKNEAWIRVTGHQVDFKSAQIVIRDLKGAIIIPQNTDIILQEIRLDLNGLAPGIYQLELRNQERKYFGSIIIHP